LLKTKGRISNEPAFFIYFSFFDPIFLKVSVDQFS
jgi:hypothetical protein